MLIDKMNLHKSLLYYEIFLHYAFCSLTKRPTNLLKNLKICEPNVMKDHKYKIYSNQFKLNFKKCFKKEII